MLPDETLNAPGGDSMEAERYKIHVHSRVPELEWTHGIPKIASSLHVGQHHQRRDDSTCRITDSLYVDLKREKSQR